MEQAPTAPTAPTVNPFKETPMDTDHLPRTTRTISCSNPRLAVTTKPMNHRGKSVEVGTPIVVEVVVSQSTRSDGFEFDPTYSVKVNGHHQCGGPARFLGEDGWPVVGFARFVDEETEILPGDDLSGSPRSFAMCPGCPTAILVPAAPTGGDWTTHPFWCPACGGTAAPTTTVRPVG